MTKDPAHRVRGHGIHPTFSMKMCWTRHTPIHYSNPFTRYKEFRHLLWRYEVDYFLVDMPVLLGSVIFLVLLKC